MNFESICHFQQYKKYNKPNQGHHIFLPTLKKKVYLLFEKNVRFVI
jgi:hypothetical protein